MDDHPGWARVEVRAGAPGLVCAVNRAPQSRGLGAHSPDARSFARGTAYGVPGAPLTFPAENTCPESAFEGYRCLFLPGEEYAQPEEQREADSPTREAGTRVT